MFKPCWWARFIAIDPLNVQQATEIVIFESSFLTEIALIATESPMSTIAMNSVKNNISQSTRSLVILAKIIRSYQGAITPVCQRSNDQAW